VIVFAREPRLGQVKSRLAASLGEAEALQTHCQLLEATLVQVRRCADVERWLCVAAASDDAASPSLIAAEGFRRSRQCDGDLGVRMAHALRESVSEGIPAVLVGCDCPPLDAGVIASAFDALAQADFVFGPTEDGGYALVGARIDAPQVFGKIEWGTSRVMVQTRERLAQARISWSELPVLWDVDDEADWRRWQRWRAAGEAGDGR
jgi:rSAM/selenodomain-associated transferase 1